MTQPIQSPEASIPSPTTTINLGTSHINETPATELTVPLTIRGGFRAENITGSITAPFDFKGGAYPGTGGDCSDTEVFGTCNVVLTYSPTTLGTHNGTMSLSFYTGIRNTVRVFNLTGTTVNNISISNSGFSFGNKVIGTTNSQTFTVTNNGTVAMTGMAGTGLAAAPLTYKGGAYPGTGGTCGANLNAGSTCTIIAEFDPVVIGTYNSSIILDYNNGINAEQVTRAMSGVGVNPASLSISNGATYDFGNKVLTSTTNFTFTVTNSGDVSATSVVASGLAAPFTFLGGTYPGTGGTCSTTIAVGTCTIVVSYTPTTAAVHNNTLQLDYNDGVMAQATTRAITGTGITAASLSISDGATYDYSSQVLTTNTDKTFTITNSGQADATAVSETGLAAPYAFKGGSFPGTGGTCTTTIANGTCTIVVTYTPTTAAVHTDTINLSYNNGLVTTNATRDVTGTGLNPATLTISDGATYDFSTNLIGTSNDKIFTVTYSGDVAATAMTGSGLAAPYTFKGGAYPGTGGTCLATLAAGTCTIVVTYTPTASGVQTDTVSLDYHNGATTTAATRALTGTGQTPALLSISDGATYDYGSKVMGSSTDKTFTVTNSGEVSATGVTGLGLASPFSFKGGAYPGTAGTCTATIAVGTCTIVVTYDPSTAAVHSDTIQLNYNDGVNAQSATRAVTGTGQNPASLSISDGAVYDYGSKVLTTANDKTFTVTNSGDVSATTVTGSGLAAPYLFKGGTYPGTGGTCGVTIGVGTCTIVVTYTPTTAAVHSDTIQIDYNDGVNSQSTTRPVTGTGITAALLSISDGATYGYGSLVLGITADKTFTITNSGTASATTVTGGGLAAPFSFKGGGGFPGTGGTCTATISTGTCTIVVTYAPTVAGSHSDTIDINYDSGTGVTVANRALTGTGLNPAVLTISDGATFDFGNQSVFTSTNKIFTVTNSGDVSATGVVGSGDGAPYVFEGGGAFPGTTGTCTGTIAVGTCTFVVTYTPTTFTVDTTTFQLDYNDGVNAQVSTRPVTGTGVAKKKKKPGPGFADNYQVKPQNPQISQTWAQIFAPIWRTKKDTWVGGQKILLKDHLQDWNYQAQLTSGGDKNSKNIQVIDAISEHEIYSHKLLENYQGQVELKNMGDQNGDQIDDYVIGFFKEFAWGFVLEKVVGIETLEGKILYVWPENK